MIWWVWFFLFAFPGEAEESENGDDCSVLLSLNTQFSVVIHEAEFSESFHSVMNTTALSD